MIVFNGIVADRMSLGKKKVRGMFFEGAAKFEMYLKVNPMSQWLTNQNAAGDETVTSNTEWQVS